MKSSKHLFGKPYFASLVCKGSETFHENMPPFCLIAIGCFCHVMNDHPPMGYQLSETAFSTNAVVKGAEID